LITLLKNIPQFTISTLSISISQKL
jgi:hypothetical protein